MYHAVNIAAPDTMATVRHTILHLRSQLHHARSTPTASSLILSGNRASLTSMQMPPPSHPQTQLSSSPPPSTAHPTSNINSQTFGHSSPAAFSSNSTSNSTSTSSSSSSARVRLFYGRGSAAVPATPAANASANVSASAPVSGSRAVPVENRSSLPFIDEELPSPLHQHHELHQPLLIPRPSASSMSDADLARSISRDDDDLIQTLSFSSMAGSHMF
eukprot:TRINITY_DN513_c0_g1::TRINITY_DN513_c0_g1_i1::g.10394::m.10394 TRINITY_DN513_c0_g1::TRINITY_DN513_c0_g1_i1::g.10394  ORF type:complete len:217 (-),score=16.95 TRINITY_DN513_c0_g1_i1:160-810(-)